MMLLRDSRGWLFVAVVAVATGGVAGYVAWRASTTGAQQSTLLADLSEPVDAAQVSRIRQVPHLLFLSRATDSFDHVGLATVDAPSSPVLLAMPTCERSHFGARGGLCLQLNRESMQPRAHAVLFDANFRSRAHLPLIGLPIRTRVSPDFRWGAATVFVTGESYAGDFTTRTTIIDLTRGEAIGDLEQFTTERDGKPFKAVDFNFWGVTFFATGDRFLATLGTGGQRFLVEGDIARRHMTVRGRDVECPSLSPDGQRIVFKRATKGTSGWRLWALDLTSGEEWPITDENRDIDDQAEWLDNERVLYGVFLAQGIPQESMSIWVSDVSRDSGFDAEIFIRAASSPSVIR